MAFAEDLSPFFDTAAGFAVVATRTPAGGGGATAGNVILDGPGAVLDSGVITDAPTALIPATQWSGVAEGDAVVVDAGDLPATQMALAGSYVVRQVLPEADGATVRLVLARS